MAGNVLTIQGLEEKIQALYHLVNVEKVKNGEDNYVYVFYKDGLRKIYARQHFTTYRPYGSFVWKGHFC